MRFYFVILLFLLVSCHKDDTEPGVDKICANCILGKWELSHGVKISGGDTLSLFENGELIEFWYGERRSQYQSELTLEFLTDSLIYYEFTDKWPVMEDNIKTYRDGWEWLNTSYSKTHIRLRNNQNSNEDTYLFRIVKLTENELEIDYNRGFSGGGEYLHYYFTKVDDYLHHDGSFKSREKQNPGEILGSWELIDYLDKTNDSVYSNYDNDTLTIRQTEIVGWPGTSQLTVYKYPYNLSMLIGDLGEFRATENKDLNRRDIYGYWYWTDPVNPHEKIYIEPLITNCFLDFELQSVNNDTLELYFEGQLYLRELNTQIVYYKFIRK